MDEETVTRAINKAKKDLRRLERSPYKSKQKYKTRRLIISLEATLFSQKLQGFRKKLQTSPKLEERYLGRSQALKLVTHDVTIRDSLRRTPTKSFHQ